MTSRPLFAKAFDAFDNKTVEQQQQEVADREEIRELIARYALGITRGAPVYELFTEDAYFVDRVPGRPARELRSFAAIKALYDGVPRDTPPLPMIHNIILDIDGDKATGLCSIEIRWVEDGEAVISSGYYDDEFRRVDGRWKFAGRDVKFFHWCKLQDGWA